jgi:hypothetical protein
MMPVGTASRSKGASNCSVLAITMGLCSLVGPRSVSINLIKRALDCYN